MNKTKLLENGDIKFTRTPLFEPPKLIIGCDLAAEGTSDYSVTWMKTAEQKSKIMKHYVTFGQVHVHRVQGKTLDCDTVAVYEAESWKEGREKAFDLFGDKFFTDYHGDNWNEEEMLPYFPRGYVYLK